MISAPSTSPSSTFWIASSRCRRRTRLDRVEQALALRAARSSRLAAELEHLRLALGTRLTNATRGLSGPRESAKPTSTRDHDRVEHQQRRRAAASGAGSAGP